MRFSTFLKTTLTLCSLASAPLTRADCPMHPNAPPELSKNHDCCRIAQEEWEATLARIAPSDESLYQIESKWENQNGQIDTLAQLAGRPQVLAMAYTNCEYACPRLLADLKAIESQIAANTQIEIGFTLITFDPKRDTAERFQQYAKNNKLDLNHWTLLRGDPADTLELANLLGVRYKQLPNEEFTHSNIITLLNDKGEITAQIDGLGADPQPILQKISPHP